MRTRRVAVRLLAALICRVWWWTDGVVSPAQLRGGHSDNTKPDSHIFSCRCITTHRFYSKRLTASGLPVVLDRESKHMLVIAKFISVSLIARDPGFGLKGHHFTTTPRVWQTSLHSRRVLDCGNLLLVLARRRIGQD